MIARPVSVGLADLAANVLAVVLVAVLLGLHQGAGRADPAPPHLVAHRPLDPEAMVAHLAGARRIGGDVAVDLSRDVTLRLPGEPPRPVAPADVAAADPAVALGRPVRLNVFDARHYEAVRTALSAAGVETTELSVPDALRGADRGGWSDGFLALVDHPTSLAGFRRGLDDLLSGRGSSAGHPVVALGWLPSFGALFVTVATVVLTGAALWIERRHAVRIT